MKKIDKFLSTDDLDDPSEELEFLLWKAELNKELLSFWKSMSR